MRNICILRTKLIAFQPFKTTLMFAFLAGFIFFFFAIFLVIAILYLVNLQNTLKAASPENRKMPPANVWLLLIPLFNIYWMFVVVKRISETIAAEYQSKGQALSNAKPTYNVGMAMAALSVISSLISIVTSPNRMKETEMAMQGVVVESQSSGLQMVSGLISLVVLVLWIVHWVQTAGYKNKMKMLPNNKGNDSQIFQGM